MLIVSGTIKSLGVDYITLTRTQEEDQSNRELEALFKGLFTDDDLIPAKWGGYKGYTRGHARMGHRTRDGVVDKILNVSGSAADSMVFKDGPLDENIRCTRIDIQMTVELPYRQQDLARRYFANLKSDESYKSSMVGRRKIVLVDSEDGQTMYIGSRSSRSFLVRLYDKGGQMGFDTGYEWRLEIEFKRDLARGVLDMITGPGRFVDNKERIVTGYAEEECGILLPSTGGEGKPDIKPANGSANQMEWLKRCVRPVVVRETNTGHLEEVIEALGLSWVLEPEMITARKLNQAQRAHIAGSTRL